MTDRRPRRIRSRNARPVTHGLRVLLALLLWAPVAVHAHTLGIDKGELTERGAGGYALVAKVPPALQPAISAPELPGRCELQGNPRGERGSYSVRFEFTCESALTADDQLALPWLREGVMLTVRWKDAEPVTRLASRHGAVIPVHLSDFLAGSGTLSAAARRYTRLGIEHILEGVDHLLFVLVLLLMVQGGWRLVKTITAFTVAHSITLGLATLGYLSLPPAPVEAAIALSIVFLCVETLHARAGREGLTVAYPWLVAFAFGLLHGLGFAGALAEIGLPPSEIPVALLFFNVGVEIGQLLFIAVVMLALALLQRVIGADRSHRMTPAAETIAVYGIGTVATYWLLERAGAMFVPA